MTVDQTGRSMLERRITFARPLLALLSLVGLIQLPTSLAERVATGVMLAYLPLALLGALGERFSLPVLRKIPWPLDLAIAAGVLCLTPSFWAAWPLLLLVVFALAIHGYMRAAWLAVGVAASAVMVRLAAADSFGWRGAWYWLAAAIATAVSGFVAGFLGTREREQISHQQVLEKILGLVRFDRGLTESIRQVLGELALEFDCELACLAADDDEVERVFVWKVRPGEAESAAAETWPQSRADAYLLDCMEVSMAWRHRNGTGAGIAWDRRTGERFAAPLLADVTRKEFGVRSLLAVTIESAGRPAGRILLINARPPRRGFSAADLRWLETIVRHAGPPLENVFLLRNLRARAVESERSRISRDLHDGILQTLLSLKIQLDVLRQKPPVKPERTAKEFTSLHKTVQEESEELRRMVTDLRPLRVESADLRELMMGLAERFRAEYDLPVDVFVDDRALRLPDRVCRELFQIYREALHNVKKHANASHVVVKLVPNDSKVSLIVDDNGLGFSFSGRYTSEDLDRLRLGPISIKERTRTVGGTLTLESNPGHGARLTIDIPIN